MKISSIKSKNTIIWNLIFSHIINTNILFYLFIFFVCVTPWTVARQAPLTMGFSRQEYWSGLSFPSPNTNILITKVFQLVHFSHSVVSDFLGPNGLQHSRLPCPSPTPRAYSNSCPSSQWCHPTISSFVLPFSSHLQSFPASWSIPMSPFFTTGSQSYWSFMFSISPSTPISFRMDWLDLLAVQGTLKSLLQHHNSKASILWCSVFFFF